MCEVIPFVIRPIKIQERVTGILLGLRFASFRKGSSIVLQRLSCWTVFWAVSLLSQKLIALIARSNSFLLSKLPGMSKIPPELIQAFIYICRTAIELI